MKVASTADAELLVISAMMFSKMDLSVAKLVSSIPLMVRLVDIVITAGVSKKFYSYIYVYIIYTIYITDI